MILILIFDSFQIKEKAKNICNNLGSHFELKDTYIYELEEFSLIFYSIIQIIEFFLRRWLRSFYGWVRTGGT